MTSIKCRLIDINLLESKGKKPVPGDMWYLPWIYQNHNMSQNYLKDWSSKRPPICVCLPNKFLCIIDLAHNNKGQGYTVTGKEPNITILEPITSNETYYLIDGFLKDSI